MLNHPEVPPGCPYFWPIPHDESDTGFGVKGSDILWCCCHAKDYQRPIIASVARCAWLDEAYKIGEEMCGDPFSSGCDDDGFANAHNKAEEWRKWGAL